jgi:hypothetical protein
MSRWSYRIIGLTIPLACLELAWIWAINPVIENFDDLSMRLDTANFELERLQRTIAHMSAAEARLAAATTQATSEQGWLEAANAEQAEAILQGLLKLAVEKNGGTIQSIQVISAPEVSGIRKIGLRIVCSSSYQDAAKILQAVRNTERPKVWIEDFSLRVTDQSVRQLDQQDHLAVELAAFAYLRPGDRGQ